jgi:hypothetical protein
MPRVRLNRPTIDGCRFVLNAHVLRANGCLRPGWSGKWVIGESSGEGSSGGNKGAGKASKVSIRLRVERSGGGAGQLHLSWNRRSFDDLSEGGLSEGGLSEGDLSEGDLSEDAATDEITDEMTESVALAHIANHFGGYTLFVCPGLQGAMRGAMKASDDANDDANNGADPEFGSGEAGIGAGSAAGNNTVPGAGSCGRRVVRLYLTQRYFLCRQCSQLVHVTPYELPWQRALRRANKLRRRLGVGPGVSTALAAPPKPRFITVDRYKYLLDKLLWPRSRSPRRRRRIFYSSQSGSSVAAAGANSSTR